MNRFPILKGWLGFGFWKNLDAFVVPGFFIFAGFLVACTNDANFNLKEGVASIRSYNQPLRRPSLIIDGGEKYTDNSVVNLGFNADGEASEMFISMDSDCSTGSWEPFQESKDWELADFNQETIIYVKYKYEQVYETDCVYGSIVHDDVPPELEFIQGVDALWIANRNLDISFQVSDSGSGVQDIECDFQGNGQFGSCQSPLSFSSMRENINYLVKVRVWDRAGNVIMKGLNWISDQSPPEIVFNNTPGEMTSDDNPSFNFIATDTGSGVDTYFCRLDGQDEFKECENHLSFSNLQEGHHLLQVKAMDKVGNVSNPIDYSWIQDMTVPSIRFTRTPTAETKDQQALFQFSGVDNQGISSYLCKLDQGSYKHCSSPYSSSNLLSDGRHVFSVMGVDPAGNTSSPITYRWRVDTSRPTIEFAEKPDSITRLNWAYFGFHASDKGSGVKETRCSLDGANYEVCGNFLDLINLSQGIHTLQVHIVDHAGNLSDVIQHRWQIDQSKPRVRIVSTGEDFRGSNKASLMFEATDEETGIQKIECRLNGKPFRACESPMNYSGLPDGEHSFFVKAEDKAGNVSSVQSYSWLVDTQAPLVHFTEKPDETVYIGSEARIQFTINDGAGSGIQSYQCFFNGEPYNCAPDIPHSFMIPSVSDNNFRITVFDRHGNSATEILNWKNRYELIPKQFAFSVNEDRPIDVLFVIDNSRSMNKERKNLSEKIDGFLQKVEGFDWQIGVISTEIENKEDLGEILRGEVSEDNDYKSGRLIFFDEDLYILHSGVKIQGLFEETMQTIPVDDKGDEQAIYATVLAIERALDGQREGEFFRPDAHLSIVVLSDENENSDGGYDNKGVLVDPDKIQYTPSDFLTFAKNFFGADKEILWHSIVIMSGDEECRQRTKEQRTAARYGRHYEELSRLTGGVIGSICSENYTNLLKDIGQTVKDLQDTISLECVPEDTNLDGRPDLLITHRAADESDYLDYQGTYSLRGQKLVFDEYMEPGDYELKFSCRK